MCSFYGFSQIIPPKEWSANSKKVDDEYMCSVLEQKCKKMPKGGFELSNHPKEKMKYKDYILRAEQTMDANLKMMSLDGLEDQFWDSICKTSKMYSYENEFSLFEDQVLTWNLGTFTSAHSNIHAVPSAAEVRISNADKYQNFHLNSSPISTAPETHHIFFQRNRRIYNMPGIQKPYIYFGTTFSLFAFHLEDGNLNSINYLHEGAPKVW